MPDPEETGVTPEPNDRIADAYRRQDDDSNSPDKLLAALQKERDAKKAADEARKKAERERAELSRKLQEFEEDKQRQKDGEMSEIDRLRKERVEKDKRLQEVEKKAADSESALVAARMDVAVERQALAMGFLYPSIAPNLIDRAKINVDPDTGQADAGDIKSALDRIAKTMPDLLRARAGGGTPPREGPTRRGVEDRRGRAHDREPDLEAELLERGGYF